MPYPFSYSTHNNTYVIVIQNVCSFVLCYKYHVLHVLGLSRGFQLISSVHRGDVFVHKGACTEVCVPCVCTHYRGVPCVCVHAEVWLVCGCALCVYMQRCGLCVGVPCVCTCKGVTCVCTQRCALCLYTEVCLVFVHRGVPCVCTQRCALCLYTEVCLVFVHRGVSCVCTQR